jgi:hypothetical protein
MVNKPVPTDERIVKFWNAVRVVITASGGDPKILKSKDSTVAFLIDSLSSLITEETKEAVVGLSETVFKYSVTKLKKTGSKCPVCGKPQYISPSGATCPKGHG